MGIPGRPFDEDRREAFLDVLREVGIVRDACRVAGVGRSTAYEHRREDPAFAAAWDEAVEDALDLAERELLRRGRDGVDKPVYQGGQMVGTIREFSDTALLAYLNAHAAHRGYVRNARVELSGPGGSPVQHEVRQEIGSLTLDERAELRKLARRVIAERATEVPA